MQYFSAFPVPATAGFPLEFYGPNSGQNYVVFLHQFWKESQTKK
jgi:hypothetical protein